ncbi:DUF7657 domain-containing protein [Spirosoma endophyticum]|uniref:Uncharacterized protein n=1 Tax=Spirosoma endophyticum TaxID=662367 RepID=A0A1I1X1S2_9BACT|nr:hypothetical protein [Spirosoma endophyticum]SFE01272.1 hypothetical protein SAMN05216167_109145 [Spirosoma endophyticum]
MSKKQKGRSTPAGLGPVVKPASALPTKPLQPLATPSENDDLSDPECPFELIRFDKRVKITLGAFVALFVLFVLFKWHYVSLPMWNTLLPDGSPATRGLVAGTPKRIRMDDYAVGAPWILSNALNGYPLENEAIGGLKSPMLTVPVKHPVAFFKIGSWGMFLPDLDRAYAWMYDTSPFVLLVGAFLFFLLVTRNDYWLSLTGTLTLLLSSGTVRWSFIPANMIGYSCAAFVAAVYLLYERKPLRLAIAALLLVWLVCAYALILYPPYQLPMAYLFGLALVGYVINNRRNLFPLKSVLLKIGLLAGAAVLAGLMLAPFFSDIQETLKAVTSTVYPGQRSETGGTGFIANWYSEYYSWFFSDEVFPKSWLNICELSHYLNFAPVIIPLTGVLFVLNRKVDWMLVAVSVFVLFMWVWIEVGFGQGLAKASLMSMVPTRRAQIPMGVGGIVLLILYLNAIKNSTIRDTYKHVPVWGNVLAIVGVIGFVVYTAYVNVNDSDGLIKPYQTFVPVVFFSLLNILLIFTLPIRYRASIFCAGLLIFLLPNLKANPLSKGVSPITENAFYKTVRQLVEQDPQARWLVNGNQFITYMVTATGAKQITGVKYLPDRKHIFSVLDPQMKRDSAYNRYAHVTNQSYIDGKDSVILVNQYEDGYVIAMDPCSPRMKKLNVKYQVFDHQPQPVEVRCMKSIATLGSLTIYQVNP